MKASSGLKDRRGDLDRNQQNKERQYNQDQYRRTLIKVGCQSGAEELRQLNRDEGHGEEIIHHGQAFLHLLQSEDVKALPSIHSPKFGTHRTGNAHKKGEEREKKTSISLYVTGLGEVDVNVYEVNERIATMSTIFKKRKIACCM